MFHEFPRVGVQLTAFIQWAFCLCGWPPIFVSPFQWLHEYGLLFVELWPFFRVFLIIIYYYFYLNFITIFFREFQPIMSALDNNSLLSDQDTNQFLVLTGIEPQTSYTTIKDFISFYNNLTIKSWWIWILRYFRRFQNIFICHCSDLLYVLSGEIIQIRDVPLKNIKKYHLN